MRLRPGGLLTAGVVCSSWVTVNRAFEANHMLIVHLATRVSTYLSGMRASVMQGGTSGRSPTTPMGNKLLVSESFPIDVYIYIILQKHDVARNSFCNPRAVHAKNLPHFVRRLKYIREANQMVSRATRMH